MCQEHEVGSHSKHICFPFFPHQMRAIGEHIKNCMGRFGSWIPYNIEELGDGYLITVPLPGRSKEEVKVSLIGKTVNIKSTKPKGEKEESEEDELKGPTRTFLRKLFTFIDVNMDISLPADADENTIKSHMSNGVLRIKTGKKPPKDINVEEERN